MPLDGLNLFKEIDFQAALYLMFQLRWRAVFASLLWIHRKNNHGPMHSVCAFNFLKHTFRNEFSKCQSGAINFLTFAFSPINLPIGMYIRLTDRRFDYSLEWRKEIAHKQKRCRSSTITRLIFVLDWKLLLLQMVFSPVSILCCAFIPPSIRIRWNDLIDIYSLS